MDNFGYPWIYPLSEQKAMDIHGYIHTGLWSRYVCKISGFYLNKKLVKLSSQNLMNHACES